MLRFRLVTPERILFDEEATSISLPTAEGEITVLPTHIPLASLLVAGIAKVNKMDGTIHDVAVSGGFIRIGEEGTVTVLADTAETAEELDLSVIEEAKKRAEDAMKNAARKDDVSFAAAAAALERELARYRVASKHRRSHRLRP